MLASQGANIPRQKQTGGLIPTGRPRRRSPPAMRQQAHRQQSPPASRGTQHTARHGTARTKASTSSLIVAQRMSSRNQQRRICAHTPLSRLHRFTGQRGAMRHLPSPSLSPRPTAKCCLFPDANAAVLLSGRRACHGHLVCCTCCGSFPILFIAVIGRRVACRA